MSEHSMAWRAAIVGASALAITAGGFAAYAAIPSPGGTINGCFATADGRVAGVPHRKGEVRVVKEGEACTSYETPISWSQRGPQGEPGAQGPAGVTGYEIVRGQTTVPADGDQDRVVSSRLGCPGDKVALTGGFDIVWRGAGGQGPVWGKVGAMGVVPSGDGYHFDVLVEAVPGASDYLAHQWVACADVG